MVYWKDSSSNTIFFYYEKDACMLDYVFPEKEQRYTAQEIKDINPIIIQ